MSNQMSSWNLIKVEPQVLFEVAKEFFLSASAYFEKVGKGAVTVSEEFLPSLQNVARLAANVLEPLDPEAKGDVISRINVANWPCRVNASHEQEVLAAGFAHSDIARYESGIFNMYEAEPVSDTECGRREQRNTAIQVLRDFVAVNGMYTGLRLKLNEQDNSIVQHFLSRAEAHLENMSRETEFRAPGIPSSP